MAVQIQFRRDTAAAWTAANPVLAAGELGLETDTTLYKIGNGSTAWNSLAYGTIAGVPANNSITLAMMTDRAVGSAELDNLTLNAQTGTTYTLVLADAHKLVTQNNVSAITTTIPPNSSVAFEIGDQVNLLQLGAGQVTVAAGAGVTIRSEGSKLKLKGQYAAGTCVKIDTDEWVLVGNLSA